ncbi:MAG TPA: response regulator transcription factor [Symbiobacteriaceae bacterium]|nr:response regulator transcription factor [Symbiobacteriaceae bacterium]
MYRVFLVEDNPSTRQAVTGLLTRYGYEVVAPLRFDRLVEEFEGARPHLVLLDINLPVFDGFHVCRELRSRSEVPIIFLTSRDSDMDQVMGMTLGGDDYITKPYSGDVLLARVSAVLRRVYGRAPLVDAVEHGGLRLDLSTGVASHGAQKVELTRNELKLLHALMEKQGTLVTREQLMERLWSSDLFIDENTLTVNIARLRAKLAEIGLDGYIETRRGLGYIVS